MLPRKENSLVLYQRDNELRRRINGFLQNAFSLPESDYYAQLDLQKLLSLKSALSDINNALTMRLTLGFLDWATKTLSFDADSITKIRDSILGAKPSSNGYDIYCSGPIPFIAEVKCNIPVNGGAKYGAAQRIGIAKDINALQHGKSKASSVESHCLKFMVFIDLPEVRAANARFLSSKVMASKAFRFIEAGEVPNDSSIVYGVYAALAPSSL